MSMKGFVQNIETKTLVNEDFRRVLYTSKHCQLVVMRLLPGEEIGEEVHDVDQFFRFESGEERAVLNGEKKGVTDGDVVIVPAGVKHNVINVSDSKPLQLYTLYCPPHHKDGVVHATKRQAETDNEHFDGKTSE